MTDSDRQVSSVDGQTSPPRLSIVIVTWNNRDYIGGCLGSLKREVTDAEVIVVDNNSADETRGIVQREFPWVRLIRNSGNPGYARANNLGIEASRGEYILLLNPDTEVNENAVHKMVEFAKSQGKEVGGVAPQLVNPDLTVQPSCRTFPTLRILAWEFLGLSRLFPRSRVFSRWRMGYFDFDKQREVDQPMGSCLMQRRATLEDVGILDENFVMFFNDVDLCFRIKKGGWKISFYPQAKVIHHKGASTRKAKVRMIWLSHLSFYKFFKKFRIVRMFLCRLSGNFSSLEQRKNAFVHNLHPHAFSGLHHGGYLECLSVPD